MSDDAAITEADAPQWAAVKRDYIAQTQAWSVHNMVTVHQHPLNMETKATNESTTASTGAAANTATSTKTVIKIKAKNMADLDPLSALAADPLSADPLSDPLSALSISNSNSSASSTASISSAPSSIVDLTPTLAATLNILNNNKDIYAFEEWRYKKAGILKKYTTDKSIPVVASFLDEKAMQDTKPVAVDQAKQRVEQLEVPQETAMQMMTQKEYIYNCETSHDNLRKNWESGDRVQALKIAIQSAKLLNDISVPQFYPSAFVLITDILDTFGALVFDRLKNKGMNDANGAAVSLPDDFTPADVNADAKETCRNWFYKTACIRELLPRLYIELALVNCYRFLVASDFLAIIRRLSRCIRGIGDPLAASFARAYLCSKARELCPNDYKDVLLETFQDFLLGFKQLKETQFASVPQVAPQKVTVSEYLDLLSPAVQWLVQNVGFNSNEDVFLACIQQYRECCASSAVLVHLLAAFKPQLVSKYATSMTQLVRDAEESSTPKSRLYYTLGVSLVSSAPPKDQRLQILNDVWKAVTKISDPTEYMEIAQIFVEYLLQHFSSREINILLADVLKHVKKEQAFRGLQNQLQTIIFKILQYRTDFDQLMAMDNFMPLLDLLEKEHKLNSCKAVLESFAKNSKPTSDAVIIQTVFEVARGLHDSIDSLTFDDERRQVSLLIVSFIRKIDFGNDLEQQFNILVECRSAFTNLDIVTREIVLRVCLLCMKAHRFMHGKHSKKTAAFVKACLAFCHITIPSLDDAFVRLHLFVECAQVALVNSMVGQSEGMLKAAISLIPDVPVNIERDNKTVSTEPLLVGFLNNFASFLLLFPGHPEHGPFHLLKGLLNAVKSYKPWENAGEGKTRVYLGVLTLFCAYAQVKFPYHIDKVESNDTLYGGDPKYMQEISTFVDKLIEEVLLQLSVIGERGDINSRKQQANLALEMTNTLLAHLQPNAAMSSLVLKLYGLAQKNSAADENFLRNTLTHMKSKKLITVDAL